jgi:hypothetical protein
MRKEKTSTQLRDNAIIVLANIHLYLLKYFWNNSLGSRTILSELIFPSSLTWNNPHRKVVNGGGGSG